MSKSFKKYHWSPWNTILQKNKVGSYGVVILNRPINFRVDPNLIVNIWNAAKFRITVDGGTDCWLSWIKSNNVDPAKLANPDLITGDMDSIKTSSIEHYKMLAKTNVIVTLDQNETDFTKALREANKYCDNNSLSLDSILVFCEISGRFDQLISNVNTLFKVKRILPGCKVYLLCPDSVTWLLEPGEHTIDVPYEMRESKEWCGLLPIGSSAQVTTTGLKWNLSKSILEFGNLISSSNTYGEEEVVTVQTDAPIVWTMGIQSMLEKVT